MVVILGCSHTHTTKVQQNMEYIYTLCTQCLIPKGRPALHEMINMVFTGKLNDLLLTKNIYKTIGVTSATPLQGLTFYTHLSSFGFDFGINQNN